MRTLRYREISVTELPSGRLIIPGNKLMLLGACTCVGLFKRWEGLAEL